MYEWENKVDLGAIQKNMIRLRAEIKRISNETLRGNFVKEEDRVFWEEKLKKANSQLLSLESTYGRKLAA